ncbi:MAG TPA: MFS transporter, partial [Gryllotalpicola sp.]
PIQSILGAGTLAQLSPTDQAALTGHSFFADLISMPFRHGLDEAFAFAAVICLIAAVISWSRGSRSAAKGMP